MISVGILSDTHLHSANDDFARQCATAFNGCDVIIHAGDLIDVSILSVFKGKEIHAVCGNSCNRATRKVLPEEIEIVLGGFSIAITHGADPRHSIEERIFEKFPGADCIIFGHTHQPVCRRIGATLFINPGSFLGTGRYGATGSFALLDIDQRQLSAKIHTWKHIL